MDTTIVNITERIEFAIQLGESHFREFKSACEGKPSEKKPRDVKQIAVDIGETLVAFANADGGELLVGIEDDGRVTGIDINEKKIDILLNATKTHVCSDTPLPSPRANFLDFKGKKIIYFQIPKGTDYIYLTSDGRCLQRKDRQSIPMSTENIKFSRNEIISREYDRKFVENAKLSDLDISLVKTIANYISQGMSPEKCLQHLELAEYDGNQLKLRKAALLLFAKQINKWHPRVQVRILKIDGIDLKTGENYNVKTDEETTENIIQLIDTSWDLLRPHLTETRFLKDATFRNQIIYPEHACREALINAIAHRDYSIEGAGIEVRVFSDRMEILSPGGLLSSISLQDIRANKRVHQSRNSLIARVLREIGKMRELGEGIGRIFELMKLNDMAAPEFQSDTNYFTVILHHRYIYSKEQKLWLDNFSHFDLSREEKTIVLLGYNGHTITINEIWEAVGITDTDYYRQLVESMYSKGILSRLIPRRTAKAMAKRKAVNSKDIPQFNIIIPDPMNKPIRITSLSHEKLDYERVYVANIPFGCDKSNLMHLFSQFGEISNIHIPIDKITHFQKGYAFVEFTSKKSAQAAIAHTKRIAMDGRFLVVMKYQLK